MIKKSTLAGKLQEMLNEDIGALGLDELIPSTSFYFHIFTDAADYKKAEVDEGDPNRVTVYLNGMFRLHPGASSEGSSNSDYVGAASASVELLIPFADLTDEEGASVVAERVSAYVASVLQYNKSYTVTEEDGIRYFVSVTFSMPYIGERAIRGSVGDSVPVSFDVDYGFVSDGVPSSEVRLYVYDGEATAAPEADDAGWERILPARLGFARASVQDGNVLSDSGGASRCTTSASAFTVTLDAPIRSTALDAAMLSYVIRGDLTPFYARVVCGEYSSVMKMHFSQAGLNSEIPYAASTSITLVEVV